MEKNSDTLTDITDGLAAAVSAMRFAAPVATVYNPLLYARAPWDEYCRRYSGARGGTLLVGLNPGPFGMAQVGVPFGEIAAVRDWMGITAPVGRPPLEHPKRPVLGFACARSEVSGRRLWGWAAETWGTPERFFAEFFVTNYCPLVFMEQSGANLTPDKLPSAEREPLYAACDLALRRTVILLGPAAVVGLGAVAANRAAIALAGINVVIGSAPHPSPANPAANRGWTTLMNQALSGLGIKTPRQ